MTSDTIPQDQHLSDEEFAGLLAGALSPKSVPHLHQCARCLGEYRRVSDSLGAFNYVGLEWAEARARVAITAPSLRRQVTHFAPALALAAALLVAIGLTVATREGAHTFSNPSAPPRTTASAGSVNVSADNQLLADIDQELQWSDENSSALVSSTTPASTATRLRTAERSAN